MSTIQARENNKHKIAICQITSGDDKKENFNICKNLIKEAKNQEAKVKKYKFYNFHKIES